MSGGPTSATPPTKPLPNGADSRSSDTLPGATVAEFAELHMEYDSPDGVRPSNAEYNAQIAKQREYSIGMEMKGYPPEVVGFEQRQSEAQRMLVDLPLSEREFYASALATLSEAYRLVTDKNGRLAIEEKVRELDLTIRSAYARVMNDPVDRALSIFNPPLGEAYLSKEQREDVDRLERLREDFFDATSPAERKAIFAKAAELKKNMQMAISQAENDSQLREREAWNEANAEVDRILREAEAQIDPAKRYELIGRQLFQITPGQDRLKDKVVLAFTQRMRESEALRDKLNAWHSQVSGPLNAQSVGAPKRYTDILDNPPPVGADYIRDLSDQYTDVLRDASHKSYSITPKAQAEKLATQILEGVMRVLFAVTPVGILGDLVPSTLPDNVRMGIDFAGGILDLLFSAGAGKQVARAAKAIVGSARKIEIDNMAGIGVRSGSKRLVGDVGERIVKGTSADQALSPEAKAAAQALEKKTVAEAGPPVDPVSELAHEAVGVGPYRALTGYADPDVVPASLHPGSQRGILLDSKGDRFIELGGKAYHVRFDSDNGTWRVFNKEAPWKPQYPVRLNATTNAWEVHGDVGLLGGAPKVSESVEREIIRLLDAGNMSRTKIAEQVGVSQKLSKGSPRSLTCGATSLPRPGKR